MAITRLQNIFTSTTGRILYVNPDDFDASDAITNRGNSPLRPFVSIQRALLEVAKFSYVPGDSGQNDKFDQFTIMLYPGTHIVDNRPGILDPNNIPALTDNSVFDLQNFNNVLYKFNSTRGGVIVPRGASIVGMDLRKTKILPKFIPDPSLSNGGTLQSNYPSTGTLTPSGNINTSIEDDTRSSIFKITGSCYFWQFSIFDGDNTVYKGAPNSAASLTTVSGNDALFSRHKLTVFEYACDYDLSLYYNKLTNAFSFPSVDGLGKRSEETTIVGPGGQSADVINLSTISYNGNIATATTVQNNGITPKAHGFSIGNQIRVYGSTSPYNGIFRVIQLGASAGAGTTIDQFSYQMASTPTQNSTSAFCVLQTDTVDSASPYIFNISLRSTYGMCGMHANGAFASGFKSMVVAQYTGISLQRDVNAYVRYCQATTSWSTGTSCNGIDYQLPANEDINSKYRRGWNNYHIKASNDGYIQIVSCFAIGYSNQFVVESGADMSIANSNSSFGANSLISRGFKASAFTKDSFGKITAIIPPKSLSDVSDSKISYTPLDLGLISASADKTKLYLYGYNSQSLTPPTTILGYTIGGKTNDTFYVDFVSSGSVVTRSDVITGSGPSVKGLSAGAVGSPIQWDSTVNNWYLKVLTTSIGSYVSGSGASPIGYIARKPDTRVLSDKIYRLRLEIPSTASNAGIPKTGFVIQPLNSGIGLTSPYTNVFYIFNVEEYQKFVANSQTGIYYLTVLRGDISPTDANFSNRKYSQNINDLYPIFDVDNLVDDPNAATSSADNLTIGLVNTNNKSLSITKEAINSFISNIGLSITPAAATGGTETRKIVLGTGVSVELRRPSTIRAGNQTFEYTGYGPGNYSTAFPSRQTKILSPDETILSQSVQEAGGVSFYSGLNSNGELYIGNIVIDPVTGTSKTINNPTSSTNENNPIYNGLTIKNTINVVGGPDNTATSIFSGPVLVNKKLNLTGNLQINSNYSSINPFTGILLNTSNVPIGTRILDIQADNISKFNIDKDGNVSILGSLTGSGFLSSVRNSISVQNAIAGSGLNYNPSTGIFSYGIPTINDILTANSTTTKTLWINNATSSSNTTSGALQVTGGVGVGGNLNVGGAINSITVGVGGTLTAASITATNIITTPAANITTALTANAINISTTGIGQGDIGSNGGSDGIFGIFNTTNSGVITFQLKDGAGNNANRLSITSSAISAGTGVSFVGNGTIPVGGIIMWSGTVNNVPTGWSLCNGTNGTPDLRNRFIVGAGNSYIPGDTGGADSVTLTIDQIPAHSHQSTRNDFAANTGGYGTGSGGGGLGPNTVYTNSVGGGQAHENRPPYYALAFIMRIA